ncbi:recombinase family protein [Tautonia sociabilis]|uniref:recombinase family protein n=1 Tax=Tautonia sociabilis TaxID=2080755 RepID=UPI001F3A478B|nr:recombinase family protein [Tautonia sociabilis]
MTTARLDPPSPKLRPWHLDRAAVVYVRQSTPQQVIDHQESTARQYALADRAIALGWPRSQVQVIDDDLGRSGQSVEGRPGFQRLLAEVALDRVGLILGLEMSRLARSCKDWHHRWNSAPGSAFYWPTPTGCTTRPSMRTAWSSG